MTKKDYKILATIAVEGIVLLSERLFFYNKRFISALFIREIIDQLEDIIKDV